MLRRWAIPYDKLVRARTPIGISTVTVRYTACTCTRTNTVNKGFLRADGRIFTGGIRVHVVAGSGAYLYAGGPKNNYTSDFCFIDIGWDPPAQDLMCHIIF